MKISLLLALVSSALGLEPVVVGYFAPWGNMNVTDIPFSKVTHINYAFGTLTNSDDPSKIALDAWYDKPKLMEIAKLARKRRNRPKVLISIGGWTGSQTFSPLVRRKRHRTKLIQQLIKFLEPAKGGENPGEMPESWGLDGIDLDWEFPNRKGAECNIIYKHDSRNYLKLLKELKLAMQERFGNKKLLTAAVRVQPFDDKNGVPMTDVSKFSEYFDFINIMAYDIHGTWSQTTGPNSPLHHHKDKGDPFSLSQALESWHQAGFPKDKLVGGLAFYGRTLEAKEKVTRKSQFVIQTKAKVKGDESDSKEVNSLCDEGANYSGTYKYKFIRQDILKTSPTKATRGFKRYFDNVTMTPYIYQKSTRKFISYEDPISIKAKADYINDHQYRGVMIWELSHDFNNELVDSVQGIRTKRSSPRRKSIKH